MQVAPVRTEKLMRKSLCRQATTSCATKLMIPTRSTTGTVCRPTLIFGELPSIRNKQRLGTLASADQSYPECEQQYGERRREYAEGLRTKLIEIACGSEHVSKTWFRVLQPDAKV